MPTFKIRVRSSDRNELIEKIEADSRSITGYWMNFVKDHIIVYSVPEANVISVACEPEASVAPCSYADDLRVRINSAVRQIVDPIVAEVNREFAERPAGWNEEKPPVIKSGSSPIDPMQIFGRISKVDQFVSLLKGVRLSDFEAKRIIAEVKARKVDA